MMESARAYRISTADESTHLNLLLAVYDALSEDIRLAGLAATRREIAARCRYTHHALVLLGHLESWVTLLDDRPLQDSLVAFYIYVRSELVRLQTAEQANGFAELAMQVCETRAAWQTKHAGFCGVAQPFGPARRPRPLGEQGSSLGFACSV